MRIALALCLAFAAAPALAQEAPSKDMDRGADMMQEGAKLLFRGLMGQMEPQIKQMQRLADMLGDWSDYEMPDVLPNGDIIIRRKTPLVPPDLKSPPKEGETDL